MYWPYLVFSIGEYRNASIYTHSVNTWCQCVPGTGLKTLRVCSDEVDEIEVYGSEAQSGTLLTTYSFEVMKNGVLKCCPVVFAEGSK